jgi:PAS domain-containing protein
VVDHAFDRKITEHAIEVRKLFNIEQVLHMPTETRDAGSQFARGVELHAGAGDEIGDRNGAGLDECVPRARLIAARSALVGQLRAADEAIVENLPDPLLVLAEDRSALRANRAARQLFGLKSGAAGDLAALLRHPALAGAVERALAEHRCWTKFCSC